MTVTVTFVRHGESQDNPKGIWAGWKDAPLSDLAAAGKYFSTTKFDTIYASPLLRANATAQAIHGNQPEPFPSFIVNPNLREQHFGRGEGHSFNVIFPKDVTLEELFAKKHEKFPEGESLNDLAARAEQAVKECVLPPLHKEEDVHIAMVSHGLCISELVAALLRLDPDSPQDVDYKGLVNTGWTRVTVSTKNNTAFSEEVPLSVQVTHVNISDHLKDIVLFYFFLIPNPR
ncbi:histidine phosphatase superfamily [Rhodocollybia butyracea]|uniref:Histidine phosphatase superfamily n=1 Tax=Rhodocollybia butyracea TaxID=206335 RepID=A0A9P5Q2V8_9AGAR|nr:histidine phosphatase superfamily [Rhodocollybia butyracea]